MTISRSSARAGRGPKAGFTLVEVIIGATLGSFVLAGVLTTFVMLIRSGVSIQNYAEMDSQARRSLEQFGIDVRMASNLVSSGTTSVTLTVPNNYTSTSNLVTYAYNSSTKIFYLVAGDGSSTTNKRDLVKNVSACAFTYFDAASATSASDSTTKHVQCKLTIQRNAAGAAAVSETILSSSFTMRNKP